MGFFGGFLVEVGGNRLQAVGMDWKIAVIGKPALAFAKAGAEEYLNRMRRYVRAELIFLKDGPPKDTTQRFAKAAEDSVKLVLDERGEMLTTLEFKSKVDQWELGGAKRVTVMIGGANGHSAAVRDTADCLLALGKFTLQHELALVVFLEQLYRVYSIKRGEPYHREG